MHVQIRGFQGERVLVVNGWRDLYKLPSRSNGMKVNSNFGQMWICASDHALSGFQLRSKPGTEVELR